MLGDNGFRLYLEDVEADVAVDVDVGVEAGRDKLDRGRGAGIVVGEGEGKLVGQPCRQQRFEEEYGLCQCLRQSLPPLPRFPLDETALNSCDPKTRRDPFDRGMMHRLRGRNRGTGGQDWGIGHEMALSGRGRVPKW
jgi:hypothetical protein